MTGHRLNFRLVLAGLLWCALVGLSLAWNIHQANEQRQELALETARSFFDQIVITRRWNARHGGVYVPVTPETQPNPYLKDPRRDLRISDDLTLTLVNPAFMTRQLAEIAQQSKGVQFHITSLKPLRPENQPRDWEADALRQFEQGLAEKGEIVGGRSYRYMAPLITEQACLRCHEEQGYREGDVRGGISVTLPRVAAIPLAALTFSHLAIGLSGLLVIAIMGQMLSGYHHQLRELAMVDALTGVRNRRFFNEQFQQAWQSGRRQQTPLAVILCDIDHFKDYNDTFGHPAGDQCLRQVAQALQEKLRRGGDSCARYGGEEFVLVLPNTGLPGLRNVAEALRLAVMALNIRHPNSPTGCVTISLGGTVAEDAYPEPEVLVQQADQALYQAKQRGRNRCEIHAIPRDRVATMMTG
ncbi:diguanylate cyclase [uncultured Thiocystis sp.]|uniref:GGDEF domain-containing protein n=1 Tax=uncultured Thiocystis sp. TaxID=1202134 RepID=UPI0025F73703|nr:diguanylate cyclase [uncultured Thiocystis sp.]